MTTGVVVLGAAGRMGQELIAAARDQRDLTICGAVVRAGHPAVDTPASSWLPGVLLSADLGSALLGADVLIDFTRPEVTLRALREAARAGVPAVVGTTGFTAAQRDELAAFARELPLVFAPNMSAGVNVLVKLLQVAAAALGEGFDLELMELHHRHKRDAPSGTALRLAEVLAQARGQALGEVLVTGRQGDAPRAAGELGVLALRGGDVAGDHTVFFLGDGERLELTHRASSRRVFAQGALRAARWLRGQPPGLYGMAEVLGL